MMAEQATTTFTIVLRQQADASYTIEAKGPNEFHFGPQPFPSPERWLSERHRATLNRINPPPSPPLPSSASPSPKPPSPDEHELQELGQTLFQAMFEETRLAPKFYEAQEIAMARYEVLRLCLEIEPPDLAALPWEALFDGQEWLAAGHVPLVRRLREEAKVPPQLPVSRTLRILFVGASPYAPEREETRLPDVEIKAKFDELKEILREPIQTGTIELDKRLNATPKDVELALEKGYHVLYFVGHGSQAGIYLDIGDGDNIQEGDQMVRGPGTPIPVPAETLAHMLQDKPCLVFLAACKTGATSALLEGVAKTLVKHGQVPAVVAMQYTVGHGQAGRLAAYFFNAVANLTPVDVALARARGTLLREGKVTRDILAPVLYLQAQNAALFKRKRNVLARIFAVALVVALLFGLISYRFYTKAGAYAQEQARMNHAGQLATYSQRIIGQSPQLSLLLAAEALTTTIEGEASKLPLAEQALRDALRQTGGYVLGHHHHEVKAVTISHDNRWIVTHDGHTVGLWGLNIPVGSPIHLAGQDKPVSAVAVSDDSHWLAAGSASGQVQLWDLNRPAQQPTSLPGRGQAVNAIAMSPNSRWLITGEADGTAQVRDLNNLAAPPTLLAGHTASISTVVISPNNQWLVTGSTDGTARVWNLNDLKSRYNPLCGHAGKVDAVVISPDSHWLVTTSLGAEYRAYRWDLHNLAAGSIAFTMDDGPISEILISPDNKWLITSNQGLSHGIKLWDLNDPGKPPLILKGQEGLSAIAISPDSTWLVTGGEDRAVKLWNLAISNSPPQTLLGHEGAILSIAVSEDNQWLVTGSADKTARLWNLTTPQASPLTRQFHSGAINAMAISADDRHLLTGSSDNTALWWDLENPLAPPITVTKHYGEIHDVAISHDLKWLATASDDNTARLLSLASLDSSPITLTGHTEPVRNVVFSRDGRWLVTGSLDNTAKLWDLDLQATKIASSSIPLSKHSADIYDIALSDDSKWLVTASRDGTAQLWDLTNRPPTLITLTGHQEAINTVVFSPDSNWLVTGSEDATARVWNLRNPITPTRILTQSKAIVALAISSDSQWLVTSSVDTTTRLWNLSDPTAPPKVIFGRNGIVSILAVQPNRQYLLLVSSDAVADLWNLEDLTDDNSSYLRYGWETLAGLQNLEGLTVPAITLADHGSEITDALFSHNSHWLVTADKTGVVKWWNLQPASLIDLACQTAGRNLTPVELSRFSGQKDPPEPIICPGLPTPSPAEEVETTATVPPAAIITGTAAPELLTPGFQYTAHTNQYLLNAQNGCPAINDAEVKYGVRIIPAEVNEGEVYWKVIGVHHLASEENRSNHSIYIEVRDEQGRQLRNPPAWAGWTWQGRRPDERADPIPLDRSPTEAAGRISVYFGQKVSVWINGWNPAAADKSDRVENLHTSHPDEPLPDGRLLNTLGHHSFFVVFQLTRKEPLR